MIKQNDRYVAEIAFNTLMSQNVIGFQNIYHGNYCTGKEARLSEIEIIIDDSDREKKVLKIICLVQS